VGCRVTLVAGAGAASYRSDGSPHADAAVLSRTAREADRLIALLARNDVPVVDLLDYDGTPVDAVKVGTVKRAKGLEFGRVFIPRVDAYLVADGAAEPERVQRERRELFVGMTRARDELWLGQIRPAVAG
jgi:superfamily I DNA/RNA helicase